METVRAFSYLDLHTMMTRDSQQLSLVPVRPKSSLLKWIGNKFRYSHAIVSRFPTDYKRYFEPFVGSGSILSTVAPSVGVASDTLTPLIELWNLIVKRPNEVTEYYRKVITRFNKDRAKVYKEILGKYNDSPNGLDLLIISRTCYGGVVRFTKSGKMSTPIGPHNPISPESFHERLVEWRDRVRSTTFLNQDFSETMSCVGKNDLVYCDPPYVDSQSILYGAQGFSFERLVAEIDKCKHRGAKVALSIDGKKKSGTRVIDLKIPRGIFETEIYLDGGSSMLKRLQNGGESMVGEDVHDRLLLTWKE